MECQELTALGSCPWRVCADGFWKRASGTSPTGKLSEATSKQLQDEVYRGTAVSASFLAFAIVITVVLCATVVSARMAAKKS